MLLSQILIATLCLTVTHGKPLPSKVTRRQGPSPSSYPLDDACGNEWQYLNFDSNSDGDRARLELLHDTICSGELRAVAAWGARAASESKTSTNVVYNVFLDTEEDTNSKVYNVTMNIAGDETSGGVRIGPKVGNMIIDNRDFGRSTGNSCEDEGNLAYTVVDEDGDGCEKIHFCDIAYKKTVHAADVDCSSLDNYPSTRMDTFSRVALHETLHYSTIGPQSALGEQIVDQLNDDNEPAYDPERAHSLNDPEQDDQPGKAESNADNYAWMSLDAIISNRCIEATGREPWHTYFTESPPNYA